MKKLKYIAMFMAVLIVFLPVCFSSSICGGSTEGGEEFAAMACEGQLEESHSAVAEEERSFWQVVMPIVLMIFAIIIAIGTFGSGSFFACLLEDLFQSTFIYPLFTAILSSNLVSLTVIAVSVYMAYQGFTSLDAEKTIVFTAKCDDKINIALEEDGGDCKCTIMDIDKQKPSDKGNGAKYKVKAGQTYTITAVLEDFSWPATSAECTCTVKGLITTNNAYMPRQQYAADGALEIAPPFEINGSAVLVCCLTEDGYCLDNYMEGLCKGTVYCEPCFQVLECNMQGEGQGNMQFSSVFGKEGDKIIISYYLPDASHNTDVKAHIKSMGMSVVTLELFDDGAHSDGSREDKTYANIWNTAGVLGTGSSNEFTFDIEISYGGTIVEQSNAGSIVVIGNRDCVPVGLWKSGSKLDIEFIRANYDDLSKYSTDVDAAVTRIILRRPFTDYLVDEGINFYRIDSAFTSQSNSNIKSYADGQCNYHTALNNLKIILDEEANLCEQEGNVVRINPLFTINEINGAIDGVLSDFCKYVNNLVTLNPPVPEILTPDTTISLGNNITMEFRISDEEYPVGYSILLNNLEIYESSVMNDSVHSYIFDMSNKHRAIYTALIKASDNQEKVAYSDALQISVE
ncbi:MAG: hypothetical protein KAK00_09180 [Nanoarchaeota archaeon]|nr:hypothetical protein [Nanoarchaeota archaeon]